MGGGGQRQQCVAVHAEQDRVDQGYTGNGEAHALEEAQDLQSDTVAPSVIVGFCPTPSSGQASELYNTSTQTLSWADRAGGGGCEDLDSTFEVLNDSRIPSRVKT